MEIEQTIGQTRVQVVSGGDIRTEEADALITAINSTAVWNGQIDGAIRSVAGNLYHQQASAALPLFNGETEVARGSRALHRGSFDHVVFVIDDLEWPLRKIIYAGLAAADRVGVRTVTIPGIRLGTMIGVYEDSFEEVYQETEIGIVTYLKRNPGTNLRHVKYVLRD